MMRPIEPPMEQTDHGDNVVNLHEALAFLLKTMQWRLLDEEDRKRWNRLIAVENGDRMFGDATAKVLSLFQEEHHLPESAQVDEATAEALNALLRRLGAFDGSVDDPAGNRIAGTLLFPDGESAPGVGIVLYRRGFGGVETELARTTSAADASFTLEFQGQPTGLLVKVVAGDVEEAITRVFDRPPHRQSEASVFVVPENLKGEEPDEYARVITDVSGVIGERKLLAEARQDDDRQDLSVLARSTGWDARVIGLAAQAERLAADDAVTLPPEAIYGLLRAGLPSDKLALAQVSPATAAAALARSIESGVVSLDPARFEAFSSEFQAFSHTVRLAMPAPGSRSTYGDLLASSGITDEDRATFEAVFLDADGEDIAVEADGADLWSRARAAGVGEPAIRSLALQGKLAHLTENSGPVTAHLMRQVASDPLELIDKGFVEPQTWSSMVRSLALAGTAPADVLPDLSAAPDWDAATAAFAASGDPADLLERRDLSDEKWQAARDSARIAVGALIAEFIPQTYGDDPAAAAEALRAYSADSARKLHLAYPSHVLAATVSKANHDSFGLGAARESTAKLLTDALNKGFRFGRTPVSTFLDENRDVVQSVPEASRPDAITALGRMQSTFQLTPSDAAMEALMRNGLYSAKDIVSHSETGFLGKYGGIFDSAETATIVYRKASQVSSIAYNLFSIAATSTADPPVFALGGANTVASPQDDGVLKRFPTLESLFGSTDYCECEHCRSVLSPAAYLVDLFQFLEKQSEQDAGAAPIAELFRRRPDLEFLLLDCDNTNTLIPHIDIVNEIMEFDVAAGGAGLAGITAHNVAGVSSDELTAEPQNVEVGAYATLAEAKYPVTLPFDQPVTSVRLYADKLGQSLGGLLEAFRESDELVSAAGPDWIAVLAESLGLTPADVAILTDPDPLPTWFELFGYPDLAADPIGQLSSAKTLSRRLGVTYRELTALLSTRFINPELVEVAAAYRLGLTVAEIVQFQAGSNSDIDAAIAGYAAEHALKVADLEAALTGIDLSRVLLVADSNAGAGFDNAVVRHGDASPVDDFSLLALNLFVRLWRRLGWKIDELDHVLFAVIPSSAPYQRGNLTKRPLLTAIAHLAEVERLRTKVGLPGKARASLTALWTTVGTAGPQSVYSQRLLTRSIRSSDPAFDHPLDRYLDPAWLDQLAAAEGLATDAERLRFTRVEGHLPALQAAFGLTASDIERILAHRASGDETPLSLDAVSLLHRYAMLSFAIKLPVSELILLETLSGIDPFPAVPADPLPLPGARSPLAATEHFVEVAAALKAGTVPIAEVEYLLRHRTAPGSPDGSDDQIAATAAPDFPADMHDAIVTIADGIRAANQQFAAPGPQADVSDADLLRILGVVLPPGIAEQVTARISTPVPEAERWSVFDDYLVHRAARLPDEGGFLTEADYDALFGPNPTTPTALGRRRLLLARIMPVARSRQIRQIAVQTLAARSGADGSVVEALVTDDRLATRKLPDGTVRPLLDSLALLGDTGVEVTLYSTAQPDSGSEIATSVVHDADLGLVDTEGAQSAMIAAYIRVPVAGPYRFRVSMGAAGTTSTLRVDSSPLPVFAATAAAPGDEAGAGAGDFAELKPGRMYLVTLEVTDLQESTVSLRVQSEALPVTTLAALHMTPSGSVDAGVAAAVLVSKATTVANALELDDRELRLLFRPRGSATGFVPSTMPATGEEGAAVLDAIAPNPHSVVRLFQGMLGLIEYTVLRRSIPGIGDSLPGILQALETGRADDAYETYARATRRHTDAVRQADAVTARDRSAVTRIGSWHAVMRAAESFGTTPATVRSWLAMVEGTMPFQQRFDLATDVRNAVRSHFRDDAFQRLAQSVNDVLRALQRSALVEHLLHSKGLDRLEQLYELYLVDPGMEPVVQTSRIRLAISSVQLFVQRCLLSLEPAVPAASITNADQWEWMKRYRVWEANRRIFLYPENWLEPEFRDGKSHLFAELESSLFEGDVTADVAEDAFLAYLRKLETLARLDIVAMHIQESSEPADNVVHVIARSYSSPHEWFYRTCAHGVWSAWQAVDARVEGDHVVPVWWRDRLHLFWITFLEKPLNEPGIGTSTGSASLSDAKFSDVLTDVKGSTANKLIDFRLNWSSLDGDVWSATRSGPFEPIRASKAGLKGFLSKRAREFPRDFDVRDFYPEAKVDGDGNGGVLIRLTAPGGTDVEQGDVRQGFYLAGRNAVPTAVRHTERPLSPYAAGSNRATKYIDSGSLAVTFHERLSTGSARTPVPVTKEILAEARAHSIVQANNRITLVPPQGAIADPAIVAAVASGIPELARLMQPFFYQDGLQTFYVEPTVTETTVDAWKTWVAPPVVRKPQRPDAIDLFPEWLEDIPIIPQRPREWWKVPDRVGPVDPFDKLDPAATIGKHSLDDWVTNPSVVLAFDDAIVGATGDIGLTLTDAGVGPVERIGTSGISVGPFAGNNTMLVPTGTFDPTRAGVVVTSAGLGVVGSAGLDSVGATFVRTALSITRADGPSASLADGLE